MIELIEFHIGQLEEAIAYARQPGVDALRGRARLLEAAEATVKAWDETKPPNGEEEDHLARERSEDELLRHLDMEHGLDPNTLEGDLYAIHEREHE